MKTSEYHDIVAEAMSEAELQDQVITIARGLGYACYHTHDSRRSQPGFPDLVMARTGGLIFAELKSERGRVSEAQKEWIRALASTGATVYLWRPRELLDGTIAEALR